MFYNNKLDENILKILIQRNVLPTDPDKKIKLIYSNKFKTSSLVINNDSSPSIRVLQKQTFIYQFKCPLGDRISENNNIYVSLTITTRSGRLTRHLFNINSMKQLKKKKHSYSTTEFRKFFTENTTILEHQNNKKKLHIIVALYIRNTQPKLLN